MHDYQSSSVIWPAFSAAGSAARGAPNGVDFGVGLSFLVTGIIAATKLVGLAMQSQLCTHVQPLESRAKLRDATSKRFNTATTAMRK